MTSSESTDKPKKYQVGGQAVIEGVMMRSPNAFVVACRTSDGGVATKVDEWRSISDKIPIFKWPIFRGALVLVEALVNGVSALSFSASQASGEKSEEKLSDWAIVSTIAISFGLGILFFIIIPHFITLYLGHDLFGIDSPIFHLVDGAIKVTFFVVYIRAIAFLEDIKRVFMYHGAEHKAIFTYENGEELTVANARKYPTLHPRCGTSFLFFVLFISIILFAAIFAVLPPLPPMPKIEKNLIYVLIKIALMFPVAGLAYEVIKLSSKHMSNPFIRIAIWPGLMLQKITTREPTDDQLEIALLTITKALEIEKEKKG